MSNDIITMRLTRGKEAIIDKEDKKILSTYKWHCLKTGYAATSIGGRKNKKMLYMHRLVIDAHPQIKVDHINGNKLDNRKCNLRLCLQSENSKNRTKSSSGKTSIYKGVYRRNDGRRKCWTAKIKLNYKDIIIGNFYTEVEAAMAYNTAAMKLHGEFAKLNEIKND